MIKKENIFNIDKNIDIKNEVFQILAKGENTKIEKIISCGHVSNDNFWYNQDNDEWVILLQGFGSILFDDNTVINLETGEYIMIPAHKKHRVVSTSTNPPAIWLAVHGNLC